MAEDHKNDLIDLLTSKKLQFAKAIMYRTVSKKFTAAEKKEKYDMIIFFSPAGVASLLANHSDYKQGKVLIGGFGPATCQAIEQAGLRLDLSAPTDGAPSMGDGSRAVPQGEEQVSRSPESEAFADRGRSHYHSPTLYA